MTKHSETNNAFCYLEESKCQLAESAVKRIRRNYASVIITKYDHKNDKL